MPARPLTYAVVTFGCRVNQADSLRLEEHLRARGARPEPADTADIVIVNTCSVTASADQGARQTIRRIARENPSVRLIATGCYATRSGPELLQLPNVVRVVPNDEKLDAMAGLLNALDDVQETTAERFGAGDGACGDTLQPGDAGRTVYFLRVQTGCEEACAFCIIPSTRGRSRSLSIADVVSQANRAIAAGFKEIVLTGVHLGAYGRDLGAGVGLVDLLRALERVRGDVRFRVSSLEPMDCTGDVVSLVAGSGRFAPHFHLPLQHAGDAVLARMRRPYTLAQYDRLVHRIRRTIPSAAIGTDVIVGFPGETDADAAQLARYLERSPLTGVHVFAYSDRPGTEASALRGKIDGRAIRARSQRLRGIAADLARRFRASQVGTVREGLTLDQGDVVLTDNYLKERIPPGRSRNEWVSVRVLPDGAAVEDQDSRAASSCAGDRFCPSTIS